MSITITENQMFDYMHCPVKYDIKYNQKIPISEQESMSKHLTKIANFFYLNLLNKKIVSNSDLKKRLDLIAKENDIQDHKKIMDAISQIMKFSLWAENERLVVLDTNSQYSIQVDDVILKGNIGTIVSARNNRLSLLIADFSSKIPEQAIIDLSLKNTIDAYAFMKMNKQNIDSINVHSVKHNKDFVSFRNDGDFARMQESIKSIGKSIELGLYYPRESHLCPSCSAKDFCKYWKTIV